MMSADDEPSQSSENTLNIRPTNTNSLINEAFNLNSNFSNIQPLTVLPPSQPPAQHSRTPSLEPKQLTDIRKTPLATSDSAKSTPTPPPMPILPPAQFANSLFGQSNQPPQPSKNLSSFFDQPNMMSNTFSSLAAAPPFVGAGQLSGSGSSPSSTTAPSPLASLALSNQNDKTSPSVIFTPIPTKPPSIPPVITSPIQAPTLPPVSLPPPMSMPASIPPPPLSGAPSSTTGSANPFSAKGALNKKVYDTSVSVIPAGNTTFLNPVAQPDLSVPQTGADLFVPKPPSSSDLASMVASQSINQPGYMPQPPAPVLPQTSIPPSLFNSPTVPMSDQANNYPIGQPIINLSDRLDTSMNFGYDNETSRGSSSNTQNKNKMWNWIGNVVEKAKHGVESIVTTVDPQMKDFIHPANKPIFLVSSISNGKIAQTIYHAFNDAGFSKITLNCTDSQNSSQFAAQIVGFPCAIQSAKEKLDFTVQYMNQNGVAIAFQDFVAELSTDCWFELAVIMLKDKANNIELTIYTEAIPVSNEDIVQLQQITPADYPHKWSGFISRLPEKNFNFSAVNAGNPYTFLTYDTPETAVSAARVSHALKTLALLYKNKLIAALR